MEFQDVVRRRRMVRRYDTSRPVPPAALDRILRNALQAPSAGFTQAWGFLVLEAPEDIELFRSTMRETERPGDWLATRVEAPVLIIPYANKEAYLDRYALPDKGFTDRSDAWWPAPYWDIDTGFATLLMLLTVVDLGLGACFFALPDDRLAPLGKALNVPDDFRPIGAISIGYPDDPGRKLGRLRKAVDRVVHRGRWS
jgi:nitroreductase